MAISTSPTSLVNQMNGALPTQLVDAFRQLGIGSVLRAMRTFLRHKDPATAPVNPYVPTATQTLTLPDDAKASIVTRAYARTGTGTAGELTVDAPGAWANAAPAAGHIAVSPSGDLVFLAADAYTNVDVIYEPEKYDVREQLLPVSAGGVLSLPAGDVTKGVVILMEAEGNPGAAGNALLVVNLPGTAAAAGAAALNAAKSTVVFNAGDFTSARVKYGVASAIDVDALLEAPSVII